MKSCLAALLALALVLQPLTVLAEEAPIAGPDTRITLKDGTLIEGSLVEKSQDLIIVRVDREIFTFDLIDVDKIVTLDTLGGGARTITVTEFPYISALGGTVALGLLSWLQFDRASDKDSRARANEEFASGSQDPALLRAQAKDLRDEADKARLLGWGAAVLAAGSLGVALIPRKAQRRVFPELSLQSGRPVLRLALVQEF
ncbi:MAG: hypothetical protein WDA75_05530 [Candidatus Latescibacterota bacterium]